MQYLLIALSILLACSAVGNIFLTRLVSRDLDRLSETTQYDTLSQSEAAYLDKLIKEAEMDDDEDDDFVRVAIDSDSNRAYWISDKGLMYADMTEDGKHNYSQGKIVDTHSMSNKELSLIIEIVDALKEQDDEGSGSGD